MSSKLPQQVKKPSGDRWEKALMAAYHLGRGSTVKEAAEGAGMGVRTLQGWKAADWWREAEAEAHRRWLSSLKGKVRKSLDTHVAGDGNLALKLGERLNMGLDPASQRMEHEHRIETIRREIVDVKETDS